jgi:hypothetical protein
MEKNAMPETVSPTTRPTAPATAPVTPVPGSGEIPRLSLASRIVGVLFSPRPTYEAVAAHPRWLGVMAVAILVMMLTQGVFLSTAVGQRALLATQVSSMEAFGVTVSDEMYAQMESRMSIAPYTTAASQLVFIPLVSALLAGLLLAVFSAVLGGSATFKHVYAVVAHSTVLLALQQLFNTPIAYARGDMTSATKLSVFFPNLEEMGFTSHLLSALDLFLAWWLISIAIGIAALYRRKTGPIAAGLLATYFVIALIIAAVRS